MTRTTSVNYSAPSFPKATAASDPFLRQDIQQLAEALDTHDHTTGKGLAVSGGGGGGLTLPLTQNLTFSPDGTYDIGGTATTLRPRNVYATGSGVFNQNLAVNGNLYFGTLSSTQYMTWYSGSTLQLATQNLMLSGGSLVWDVDNAYDIGLPATGPGGRPRTIYAGTSVITPVVGTATSANLLLRTNNTNRWFIDTSGNLLAFSDGTPDIGTSADNRPRNLYLYGAVATRATAGPPTDALVPGAVNGMLAVDNTGNALYFRSGATWRQAGGGGTIPAGSITTTEIADGTIQTIDIADGAITSAKIQDGTVVAVDLASGAAASNIGTLGGALSGTLPNPSLAAGAASANIGALGGVLAGTLPNPTHSANPHAFPADIRVTLGANGPPFTQRRIAVYDDGTNWGYLAYGTDAKMRIVFSNGNQPLSFGTSTKTDNTGTYTERMSLGQGGDLAIGGWLYGQGGTLGMSSLGDVYLRPATGAYYVRLDQGGGLVLGTNQLFFAPACFNYSNGTTDLGNATSYAGRIFTQKAWGGNVTMYCSGSNGFVFATSIVGSGSLVIQSGDSYTFIARDGYWWVM